MKRKAISENIKKQRIEKEGEEGINDGKGSEGKYRQNEKKRRFKSIVERKAGWNRMEKELESQEIKEKQRRVENDEIGGK